MTSFRWRYSSEHRQQPTWLSSGSLESPISPSPARHERKPRRRNPFGPHLITTPDTPAVLSNCSRTPQLHHLRPCATARSALTDSCRQRARCQPWASSARPEIESRSVTGARPRPVRKQPPLCAADRSWPSWPGVSASARRWAAPAGRRAWLGWDAGELFSTSARHDGARLGLRYGSLDGGRAGHVQGQRSTLGPYAWARPPRPPGARAVAAVRSPRPQRALAPYPPKATGSAGDEPHVAHAVPSSAGFLVSWMPRVSRM